MAEPTTNATYNAIASEVAGFLGYSRDYTTMSANATQLAHVETCIVSGYSQFLAAHDWSFLKVTAQLTTTEPYSTGTVTVVDGVVTGSGTTFPSWAASGYITVDNGSYSVNTRDSSTQLTLNDLTVDADAGSTYELVQTEYELPDNFGQIMGPFEYEPGSGIGYKITEVGEGVIRYYRGQPSALQTGRPLHFGLQPMTTDGTESSHWAWLPWPIPDAVYVLNYRFRIHPDKLAASKYAYGGPVYRECLIESCLSKAEVRFEDEQGVHLSEYMRLLEKAIQYDLRNQSPSLGFNCDSTMRSHQSPKHTNATTYNGYPAS
jgi:hypothetical protein